MTNERPFTVKEVEALTGLRERTVRAMIADGRLRAIRLANVRAGRVPVEAVRALLGDRSTMTSSRR